MMECNYVRSFVTTTLFVILVLQGIKAQDTTPPNVTCSDVTLPSALPNTFIPSGDQYTYEDENPDTSAVTYNVTTGFFGHFFPPGRTPVTLTAGDTEGNEATCIFFVINTLTRLPVNCPNQNRTVATGMAQPTYTYTPSFAASDVTKETPGYRYHGDVSVIPDITTGSKLNVGLHEDKVVISDEVLNRECVGYILVQDMEEPNITCPFDVTVDTTNIVQFSADVEDNVGASLIYSSDPGTRFSPGPTNVTVTAHDEAGLSDSCSFLVLVNLVELPVDCPSNEIIEQTTAQSTYQYPEMSVDDLTLTDPTYQFYGDVTIDILVNNTGNYTLLPGTYIVTFRIDDTILNKTCSSVLVVEEDRPSDSAKSFRTTIIAVACCGSALVIIILIVCGVYFVVRRRKRRKEGVTPTDKRDETETMETKGI